MQPQTKPSPDMVRTMQPFMGSLYKIFVRYMKFALYVRSSLKIICILLWLSGPQLKCEHRILFGARNKSCVANTTKENLVHPCFDTNYDNDISALVSSKAVWDQPTKEHTNMWRDSPHLNLWYSKIYMLWKTTILWNLSLKLLTQLYNWVLLPILYCKNAN